MTKKCEEKVFSVADKMQFVCPVIEEWSRDELIWRKKKTEIRVEESTGVNS